ncbi:MAG: hypothetical protein ABSH29_17575 [Acidimicrobiales bacterium]|jgi:peptidoglycan/LPS O-acetylase OafA/YrhL
MRGDTAKRVLRWVIVAGLLLAYLEAASAMPWPIYGAAGFVWGAGLGVVAIGYALKSRDELPPGGLARGVVLATIGYLFLIALNQLLNWGVLHKDHKLLAFMSAFVVFVVWIAALKNQTRRRSSTR